MEITSGKPRMSLLIFFIKLRLHLPRPPFALTSIDRSTSLLKALKQPENA